ncbi:MAG: hypothetical protein QM725_15755 [Lacibacter sp.]
MNINRHNYEEIFLLYVDNELTTGQRKIVEAFVAANPDLKEEFNLLQQTTLNDEQKLDSAFITSLLKPVDEERTVTEEQLLLYVDNELDAEKKYFVENELAADNDLQADFKWLLLSKLQADETISFPDKSLLYKQEQPAKVFSIGSVAQRWAAAAAVIVLLAGAFWLMNNNKQELPPESFAQQPTGTEPKVNSSITSNSSTKPAEETGEPQVQDHQPASIVSYAGQTAPKVKISKAVEVSHPVSSQPDNSNSTQPNTNGALVVNDQPVNPQKNSSDPGNTNPSSYVPQQTNTASNVTYASYNNDDNTTNDDNVFLNEERQRKSGLKAFVKKAKRMIERKTGIQSNDSEVRFAVFAVNAQ